MKEKISKHTIIKYHNAHKFLLSLCNVAEIHDYNQKRGDTTHTPLYLKRLTFLLKLLGNPEKGLNVIHVAGTSGKGTATAELHSILQAAGYMVGSFYSPHITTVSERIMFNDKLISAKEFTGIVEYLKPYLTECLDKSPYAIPSFFELMSAIAFIYFKKKKCDFVILEAGLGGKYDATNVIKKSIASVITEIGFDHTEILGNSLSQIAKEKLGIVKKNGILFTRDKRPAIKNLMKKHCESMGAVFVYNDSNGNKTIWKNKKKIFAEKAEERDVPYKEKISTSVSQYLGIEPEYIKKGIENAFLPCRFEIIGKTPLILLDGAHNKDKISWLVNKIKTDILAKKKIGKVHFIFSACANKSWITMCRQIAEIADSVAITRHTMHKRSSASLKKMKRAFKNIKPQIETSLFVDPLQALKETLKKAGKRDLIVATGSMYMLGDLRSFWIDEKKILENQTNRYKKSPL